ncbi:MAG: cytoplasmic protein [Desulfamplus sp.]|nr:cytoplasmic protein [Desulfamplus sp.]
MTPLKNETLQQDSHNFIHQYKGLGAFGMDRKTDEETIMFYLQKFSEDRFMKAFIPRLKNEEIEGLYNIINSLLKKYFLEEEYHSLFLKDR